MIQKTQTTLFFFICLAVNLFNSISGYGQPNTTPTTIAALKAQLSSEMEKQHVAGMMLTIVDKDSVWFSGGLGYADIDKRTPVSAQHLFRQASITKLFMALGILNLIHEGKLSADTQLKAIAPDVMVKNPWEASNPITIGQLLEHSTGFADKSPFEEYNFTGKPLSTSESLKVFEKFMVSRWKPGERHAYSGVNYAILAYIIERVSGQPLNQYLEQKVFRPLGMLSANVYLSAEGKADYSKGYVWQGNRYQLVPHQPQYNAGYGSLNANALDYSHALRAYLRDWQTPTGQFLSKELLEDSETPHTYLSAKAGLKNTYAYGNECHESAGSIFRGHRGAIGGYLSAFLYNRSLGLGYAFSLNTHNETFYRYADELIRRFIGQKTTPAVPAKVYPLSHDSLKAYEGYYRYSNASQLYTGFLERIQHTFYLEADSGGAKVKLLLGGTMHWQKADSARLWLKDTRAYYPHILFLTDERQQKRITDGTMYFTRISALEAWSSLIAIPGSLLLLLSSLLFGIISLILFFFKRWPIPQLCLRISPSLGMGALLFVISTASQLFEMMKTCTPMDLAYNQWNAGKYGFAFFMLCTCVLLVIHFKKPISRVLKIYLSLVVLAGGYLVGLMMESGWF